MGGAIRGMTTVSVLRLPRLSLLAATLLLAACSAAVNGNGSAPPPGGQTPLSAALGEEDRGAWRERLLRMARRALEGGNPGAALPLVDRLLAADARDAEAARLAGDALLALGRYAPAADLYRRALKLGADAEASLGYARALLALGHAELAVAHLEGVRRRYADDPRVPNTLAVALSLAGRPGEAAALLEKARARWPEDVALANNLALALALDGRFDAAQAVLRPLADGLASNPQIRQNLALVYGLAGRFQAAERLMRVDLDDRQVETNLALFRMLRSNPADAANLGLLRPPPASSAPAREPPEPPFQPAAVPADLAAVPAALIALDEDDLKAGKLPLGDWVVRLDLYPSAEAAARAFQGLKRRFPELLEGLLHLSARDPGPQPLLIGPLSSERQARALCDRLRKAGERCSALRL